MSHAKQDTTFPQNLSCKSTRSVLRPNPLTLSEPGRGHSRVSRARRPRVPLFSTKQKTRTLTLKRCVVQPPCGDQHPQSRQPRSLGHDASPFVSRTTTPPPRAASVCPLDIGALIGVRPRDGVQSC